MAMPSGYRRLRFQAHATSGSPQKLAIVRIVALQLLFAITWASGAVWSQQPKTDTTPPDVEVVSQKVVMYVFKPGVSPAPPISSETIEREGKANDPMPVVVPNPNIAGKPIERQWYSYYAEILNRGPKVIKALKWSYVFRDKVTHEEINRLGAFNDATIRHSEKKTVMLRTPLSPPRIVNANSANGASAFEERVVIECVVYADRSLWVNPQAKAGRCDNLRDYKPR